MKISIITVTLNSAQTLESTINSVISQDYRNIEYIVVDGGSDDGTLDIIEKYRSTIDRVVIGKDDGIYDAFNKGMAQASGEYVAFLSSNDSYTTSKIISKVVSYLDECSPDILCTSIEFINSVTNKRSRIWRATNYQRWKLYIGWMPPHPGVFMRRIAALKVGYFDVGYKIAGDYDFLVRAFKFGLSTRCSDSVTVRMATGGLSNNSIGNLIGKYLEDNRVAKNSKLIPYITPMLKRITKIMQFFV